MFSLELRRNLFILYTLARLKQKAKVRGTALGYLWWFIEPGLLILLYSFVVAQVFRVSGPDTIASIAVGVTLWKWWQTAIIQATKSLITYRGIVTQVKIRISILPLSEVASQSYLFAFALVMLMIGLASFGYYPSLPNLLVAMLAAVFTLSLISLFLSFVNAFIRDTSFIMGFVLRMMFYITPILYTRERIPENYQWLVDYNPFAYLVELFQGALVDHSRFDMGRGLTMVFVTALLSWFMVRLMDRMSNAMIKNI